MAQQFAYTMKGLGKVYPPNKVVLKDIYLSFFYGAKIGVLGLNGAGKSTLLKIMAGIDKEFVGEAFPGDKIKVGYLPQEPKLDESLNVKQNVQLGLGELSHLLKRFDEINAKFAEEMTPEAMDKLLAEQAQVQEKLDAMGGWEIDHTLEQAMEALRCPPAEAPVKNLSGGEKRRVALCKLLLEAPDLLLLDEPTNHLDAESVAWLENHLRQYKGSVIAITHDRYFLDNIAEWILELDRGTGIPWKGNYSSWLEQKQKRLAAEEKTESKRQKTLERELDWIRQSPRARQAKNKARITAYETLLSEEAKTKIDEVEIQIPPGPRLGDQVIEVKNVTKAFGDKLLIDNANFVIPAGAVVGIVGPNGAGKTTLFKMLTGQDKPDSGDIVVGKTVKFGYVDQSRDALDANKSIYDEISEGAEMTLIGKREIPSRQYVSWFNFSGTDQQKKVGALSGGERNRVHLAKMLKRGSNLLLLDEPTNDLDVNTLRALEEAIIRYSGSVMVISHDRWFLNRIATHILAFEDDSQLYFHEGDYQSYEDNLKQRLGVTTLVPHRVRYKKLKK
ncbi:MAG: energy-dependent translational throttle protein EttA [Oligoflexia bacterium]|nr:energy-dependent translational throttle protein EttA [Oligoflexia bacterium]